MQLASSLRQTTLGDLLASLHRASAHGVLELIEPHARHAIHLRRGRVHAVESNAQGARLGDLAVRSGRIARPLLERARFVAHTRGIRIGQAMVASRVLTPTQLDALLALQQRERLDRLYALDDAEVRFRTARPLPAGASEQSPLEPRDVFHARPRRRTGDRPASPDRPAPARDPHQSHLAVLGLEPFATPTDVRSAYRRLVLDLHPDRAMHLDVPERDQRATRLMAVLRAHRALADAGRTQMPAR